MYPWNVVLTSSLANKSVIVKFETIMNSLNEIITAPFNSLSTTFFEFNCDNCQRRASSCLKTSLRPERTLSQLFKLLFPLPPLMSLKRKLLEREARRVQWEVQSDQLKMGVRQKLVRRQVWRTRTWMLLVLWSRLEFLVTNLRVSRSQKFCEGRDCPREECPRVSLTSLNFHNVSFQTFKLHH